MTTDALTKDAAEAIKYYQAKLNYEISPYGLRRAIEAGEQIQIVDLRRSELYDEAHIPSALSIALTEPDNLAGQVSATGQQELDKWLSKLSKDKVVVLYCYDSVCRLATRVAIFLTNKGFKTKELEGGWAEWDRIFPDNNQTGSSCATTGPSACA